MKLFQQLLTEPVLRDLGWVLLHSLWQGLLITIFLYLLLRSMRQYNAQARYLAACIALILMPILPLVTFWQLSCNNKLVVPDEVNLVTSSTPTVTTINQITLKEPSPATGVIANSTTYPQRVAQGLETLLPLITCCWLLGVLFQMAQISGGFYQLRRLKQQREIISDQWQALADRLIEKMAINRRVEVLASALVKVPTALGWLRPVILLPTSIFTNLSTEQLELIIAHELAHIRRHDYLINLFQTVIETILFYHPAVWYISHQIRIEREQACDDLVVATGGNPLIYARALTKVEYLRKNSTQLAMAANGGILMPRIKRLVADSMQYRHPSSLMVGSVIFTALTMVFLCGWVIRTQAKAANNMLVVENNQESNRQNSPQLPEVSQEMSALLTRDNLLGENIEMRRAALQALGNKTGSVIIMDAETGKVHTIVNQEWALRKGWSPASTIKLITSMAGIAEHSFEPTEKIKASNDASSLNLSEALAYSDNKYFYYLAGKVGSENIINYARQMGLGELTGINRDNEIAGKLPQRANNRKAGSIGAYGEGIVVTPMQLSVMIAAIANGGTLVVPHVPENESEVAQFRAQARRKIDVPQTVLTQLSAGMTAAVEYGTGKTAFDPNRVIAGKTGTAVSADGNNGLFISYAPVNNTKLVVVVVLKGKDVIGAQAAEVAGKIYQALGK